MNKIILTSILAISFTSALVIAAGTPVSHIFKGGDPASASRVNANFQELADRIADAKTKDVYDFHNYIADSSIQSKEFNTTGRCGDKDIRTFSRSNVTDGIKVTIERKDTNLGVVCSHIERDYLISTTNYQLLEARGYDLSSTLTGGETYDEPISLMTSTMKMNSTYADVTTTTPVPPQTPPGSAYIHTYTLVGIEDVTVPYNSSTTYTDCLKLHISRSYINHQIKWYCPTVGYVKTILFTAAGAWVTRELSDIQY